MTCDDARRLRIEAQYGELDDAARARLDGHTAECPACREDAEGLARTAARLDAWAPLDAPLDPATLGWGETIAVPSPSRRRPVLVGALAAGLVFAALVVVGAEVEVGDGALRVTLGRPVAPASPSVDEVTMRRVLGERDAEQAERFEALALILEEEISRERAESLARDRALLERLGRPVAFSRPERRVP